MLVKLCFRVCQWHLFLLHRTELNTQRRSRQNVSSMNGLGKGPIISYGQGGAEEKMVG